jgi:hypothetical protein
MIEVSNGMPTIDASGSPSTSAAGRMRSATGRSYSSRMSGASGRGSMRRAWIVSGSLLGICLRSSARAQAAV